MNDEFEFDFSDLESEDAAEADQPEEADAQDTEGEDESKPDTEAAEATVDQPEQTNVEDGETYHLKWLGEQKDVTREELIQLGQKGMDYDRVRGKLDEATAKNAELEKQQETLVQFRTENAEALQELRDFMDEYGLENPADVFDAMRIGRMTQQGVNREVAAAKVAQGRAERRLERQTKQATEKSDADKLKEKAAADLKAFSSEHPDVDLNELLPKLSEELSKTHDLEKAYVNYERKRLEAELKAAQDALKAERQNKSNAARSAGSQANTGGSEEADDFLKGFNYYMK